VHQTNTFNVHFAIRVEKPRPHSLLLASTTYLLKKLNNFDDFMLKIESFEMFQLILHFLSQFFSFKKILFKLYIYII